MRNRLSKTFSIAGLLLSFTGPGLASQRPESGFPPRGSDAPAVFASSLNSNRTEIFDGQFKDIASFPAPQSWFAVDRDGYFYDANNNQLLIFAPPYKSRPHVIQYGGGYQLEGLAIDLKSGVFAVVVVSPGSPYAYAVDFFRNRDANAACSVVPVSIGGINGAAFDREGVLNTIDFNGSEMGMISIARGCAADTYAYSAFPSNFTYLNGEVYVDKDDNFALQAGRALNVFSHPLNGRFAQPLRTIAMGDVTLMRFSSDGAHFWGSDLIKFEENTTLDEYSYYQFGKPVVSIPFKDASSVAVFPPLAP